MALKNYLYNGTYTAISNLIYEKNLKRCTVVLEIWTDSSKTLLLANKGITIDGSNKCITINSLTVKLVSEPEIKDSDIYYIISDTPDSFFAGCEGQLTKYNPHTEVMDKWVLWDGVIAYVADENKYYQRLNQTWQEIPDFSMDARVWDKWMSPEVSMTNGANPMQQMYKFIKSLPQFRDCEDA